MDRDTAVRSSRNSMVTEDFTCTLCKRLLLPPVWLTPSRTNICSACNEKSRRENNECSGNIRNQPFSKILKTMTLPCKNRDRGCEVILKYSEYDTHLEDCPYLHRCIFANCVWEGPRRKLLRHFRQEHRENVLHNNREVFTVKCEKNQEHDFYILETMNGRFIARIIRDTKRFAILIYDCDKVTECISKFTLSHVTQDGFTILFPCKITTDMEHIKTFDARYLSTINLETWHFLNDDDDIDCLTVDVIHELKEKRSIVPDKFLPRYICQQCRRFIRGSIWECERNHSVCKKCFSSSDFRHICDDENFVSKKYMKTNPTLVSLAEDSLLPCSFKIFGCKFKIVASSTHEMNCEYKSIPCPIKYCLQNILLVNLVDHMQQQHSCDVTGYSKVISHSFHEENTNFLLVYGKVFKVCYKTVNGYDSKGYYGKVNYWSVVEAGLEQEDDSFFCYEINVFTEPISKNLTIIDSCHDNEYYEKNGYFGSLYITETERGRYMSGDNLKYRVRIFKKEKIKFNSERYPSV